MVQAKIPVVDFSKEDCLKPGTSSWLSASNEVCHALEELGCFMAVLPNEVTMGLHNTLFGTLNDLFDFPIEIKRQTPYEKPLGDGYVNGNSGHESISFGRNTDETRKFIRHFWPDGNDQFRESVDDGYAKVMAELDRVVTRMVFENYGVEKYHDDHVKSTVSSLRFSKYKAKKTGNRPRLPSHMDKTFTTILYQNHVNGLEVNTKEDEWIGFDPLPSSFLVLAGDAFQVWSNGRIQSCKHRVGLRENEVRYSLGLFSFNQGVTNIPIELTDKDHPIQYKPLHQLEYLQYFQDNYSSIGPEYSVKKYCGV